MAFDNPDLIVACVIGDGEAETGPLATAWHSNKFINPAARRRGAADPQPQRLQDREPDASSSRISHEELESLFVGYGYTPYFVEGSDPAGDAPEDGRDAGAGHRRDPRGPAGGAPSRTTPRGRAGR